MRHKITDCMSKGFNSYLTVSGKKIHRSNNKTNLSTEKSGKNILPCKLSMAV